MAKLLPEDFREFLKLCNRKRLKYLLIGGYAVACYGYPRATADIDIWIEVSAENAKKVVDVLVHFGFELPNLAAELFLKKENVIRMGIPPLRLEIIMDISGVKFADCYARRHRAIIDGIRINVISRSDLIANKAASGRPKDLEDLQQLT